MEESKGRKEIREKGLHREYRDGDGEIHAIVIPNSKQNELKKERGKQKFHGYQRPQK